MDSRSTDAEIVLELGERLRRYRLQQNSSQADLAKKAGVSTRTLRNLERGKDTQLSTLVKLLRALGRLDAFEAFLPTPSLSPMELLKTRGRPRRRASRTRDE